MNLFIKSVTDALKNIDESCLSTLKTLVCGCKGTVFIMGNGGSNAIASHMAEDYTKALGKKSQCFSDTARLTCYANDYGYQYAFSKYLEEFADKDSLVILISSSGNSQNILNCGWYCQKNGIDFVILTGFLQNNSMRTHFLPYAKLDFWIDSSNYGVVECCHEIILHSII
jgi:D-sedoheptulose 7-phosphate isomerase